MAKNKVKVNIASKSYTIIGEDSTEHMIAVGQLVDAHVRDIATNYPALSVSDRAVLAGINVADEYIKTREKLMKMVEELTASEQLLIQRLEDLTADINLMKASVEEAERRAEAAEIRAQETASSLAAPSQSDLDDRTEKPESDLNDVAHEDDDAEFDMTDATAFLNEIADAPQTDDSVETETSAAEESGLAMGPDESFGAAPAEPEVMAVTDTRPSRDESEAEIMAFLRPDEEEPSKESDTAVDWEAPDDADEAMEDGGEALELEPKDDDEDTPEHEPEDDDEALEEREAQSEEAPKSIELFDDEDFLRSTREMDDWNAAIGERKESESALADEDADGSEAEDSAQDEEPESDISVDDFETEDAEDNHTEFVFGGQTSFNFGGEPEQDDEAEDYPDTSMLDKPDFGYHEDED